MRTVVQRVSQASVTVEQRLIAEIGEGLLVLAGFEEADNPDDLRWMSAKIAQLRIFDDENGVPNRSLADTGGSILLVSQFTLMASTKKGNRPSYIRAAKPDVAVPLYREFIKLLETATGKPVATGQFGADMQVALVNQGPVTLIIDSKDRQ
jgi:D-tyrosyl-tRNA(Tyr) deacylase